MCLLLSCNNFKTFFEIFFHIIVRSNSAVAHNKFFFIERLLTISQMLCKYVYKLVFIYNVVRITMHKAVINKNYAIYYNLSKRSLNNKFIKWIIYVFVGTDIISNRKL